MPCIFQCKIFRVRGRWFAESTELNPSCGWMMCYAIQTRYSTWMLGYSPIEGLVPLSNKSTIATLKNKDFPLQMPFVVTTTYLFCLFLFSLMTRCNAKAGYDPCCNWRWPCYPKDERVWGEIPWVPCSRYAVYFQAIDLHCYAPHPDLYFLVHPFGRLWPTLSS